MAIPDTFIVGAPRCGTTAMWSYLGAHPEIFMAGKKEIAHFGDVVNDPAYKDRELYLAEFEAAGGAKRVGEATVWYLYSELAAREIKEFNPQSRIIIMLRNPVDMIRSLHAKNLMIGQEDEKDFTAALALEPARRDRERLADGTCPLRPCFYREIGRVSSRVAAYFDVFGRDRVHVVIHDDLRDDSAAAYRGVLEFLEVALEFKPDLDPVNEHRELRSLLLHRALRNIPDFVRTLGKKLLPSNIRPGRALMDLNAPSQRPMEMAPGLRRELRHEFAPEVAKLSELLGRDLAHWSRTD